MTVDTKMNFDREYIAQFSTLRGEPSTVLATRLQGLSASQELDLPKLDKTTIRNWNILPLNHQSEQEAPLSMEELPQFISSLLGNGKQIGNVILHKNASAIYTHMNEELSQKGVIFTDIQTALAKHQDLILPYLHQAVNIDEHKLSALHAALYNCGVFIYVPKNVQLEVPMQSLFWHTGQYDLIPHILIVAEANSKVAYVENLLGEDHQGERIVNYTAEVFVGAGAKVTFAAVDHLDQQTSSYIYRRAIVERDGHIEWSLGQMNAGNTVSDNTTVLQGNGSTGDTKSVVVGTGDQSLNFVQKMHQFGHYTDGQMLSHGVMKDSARAIFNGITKIEKGAIKSTGEQSERVLMLSKTARGDANPILLIDENVERAGHAASVGQVDLMQLFYLMSRGISKQEAERLIILGFLGPVIQKIPLEGVRQRLIDVIERKVKS